MSPGMSTRLAVTVNCMLLLSLTVLGAKTCFAWPILIYFDASRHV